MLKHQATVMTGVAGRIVVFVVFTSVLGRSLPPAEFGFVALVCAGFAVATEALDLGSAAAATRRIATDPGVERASLEALLALRRLLGLVLFAVAVVLALGASVSEGERAALLVAAAGLTVLHLGAYQVAFQVRQSYRRAVTVALLVQLTFGLAVVVAIAAGAGGVGIALLVVALQVVQALAIARVGKSILGYRLRPAWLPGAAADLLRAGWMIGVGGMAYKLSWHAGSFLLWEMAEPAALGTFHAAQRLVSPVGEIAWSFVIPLIAAMTVACAGGRLRAPLEGYTKMLLAAAGLFAVAGYFLAPVVLALMYGDRYAAGPGAAVGALRWLCLAAAFAMVTSVLVVGELARGHARALLFLGAASLAACVAANLWAIPRHGAAGAAGALALAEGLMLTMLLARASRRADLLPGLGWLAYVAPPGLLAAVLWSLAGSPVLQLAVACAWAPATLWLVLRLPAQAACRAALAAGAAQSAIAGRGEGGATAGASPAAASPEASRTRSSRLRTFQ